MQNYDQIILDHYKQVAAETGDSSLSTMSHEYIRNSETNEILNFLSYLSEKNTGSSSLKIADVGCGNGYTLEVISSKFPDIGLVGYEYTPELLEIAKGRFSPDRVNFYKADIRDLSTLVEKDIDAVICQRVLINLLNLEDQKAALKNLIEVTKPSGFLFFIETFKSGLDSLNAAREEFDLSPVPPAHHNLNLPDDFFKIEGVEEISLGVGMNNFLSNYYYIARVFHPIALGNKEFKRNSHFVRFFTEVLATNPTSVNYSPLKIKILRKI